MQKTRTSKPFRCILMSESKVEPHYFIFLTIITLIVTSFEVYVPRNFNKNFEDNTVRIIRKVFNENWNYRMRSTFYVFLNNYLKVSRFILSPLNDSLHDSYTLFTRYVERYSRKPMIFSSPANVPLLSPSLLPNEPLPKTSWHQDMFFFESYHAVFIHSTRMGPVLLRTRPFHRAKFPLATKSVGGGFFSAKSSLNHSQRLATRPTD